MRVDIWQPQCLALWLSIKHGNSMVGGGGVVSMVYSFSGVPSIVGP